MMICFYGAFDAAEVGFLIQAYKSPVILLKIEIKLQNFF